MKAQLPATPQASLLNLRVVSPGGAPGEPRAEQGEAAKMAQTLRPVAETQAAARSNLQGVNGSPPEKPAGDLGSSNTQLRFSVDEPSGRMIVSIVDRDTSEVVRQIPAEEMLAIARQIEDRLRDEGSTQGLFVADEA